MTIAVLVTGGAGYIGAHACKALRRAGYLPLTVDNLCLGHEKFVKWGPFVKADVRHTAALIEAIRKFDIKAVMHFAAFAYVGESVVDPAKYYENNIAGLLSVLSAMRQTGCDKIVFSSTCAIYGDPDSSTISETTGKRPINPYGRSKLVCEGILDDFSPAYGLRSIALRYFNACGADPDLEVGELRDPETHLIPRALMALQEHISDFAVFGSDFPTPDGTAIRDYIHVCDLADAHVIALGQLLAGSSGGAFNLGVGRGHSVAEVLKAIATVTGQSLPTASGPRRVGDPAILVADPSLAARVLGFRPTRSDLETIVSTSWNWHKHAHPKRLT